MEAVEGAQSPGGVEYLIERYRPHFQTGQVALDLLCRPTAARNEVPALFRAGEDGSQIRFATEVYQPFLLAEFNKLRDTSSLSAYSLVIPARSVSDLDGRLRAVSSAKSETPGLTLDLPATYLLDPILVLHI